MKRRILSLLLALVLCMAVPAYAANAPQLSASGEQLVMDTAALLTQREASALNARLLEVSRTYGAQLVVITLSSMEGNNIDTFIESVYDGMELGYGSSHDGALLLVSMDPREYRILTNGLADEAIGASGIDAIGSLIVSDLSDGNYANAFHGFADECEYYLNGHLNGFPFDPGGTLLLSLIIGLVIGLVVVLILRAQLKSVRKQHQANVYIKPGSMHLTVSRDLFLYRTVDRHKKETSSSGSSRPSRSVGGGSF